MNSIHFYKKVDYQKNNCMNKNTRQTVTKTYRLLFSYDDVFCLQMAVLLNEYRAVADFHCVFAGL